MTVDELVAHLGLTPHPEGGFYRETFRSALAVPTAHGLRAASTAIYFLLPAGHFSAWHAVQSDEQWHFHLGGGLRLHLLDERGHRVVELGTDLLAGQIPQAVVPAGVLQAAEPVGAFALVGCAVAPGFDFEDFELPEAEDLHKRFPGHAEVIGRFTR